MASVTKFNRGIMTILFTTLIALTMTFSQTLIDFESRKGMDNWVIVNDGVMGGLSSSKFETDEKGFGRFSGVVRLENNGGFASVRHSTKVKPGNNQRAFKLVVKGDGKRYQLRIKQNSNDYFSYVRYFETDQTWQEIVVNFDELSPTFRGRQVQRPNYSGEHLSEIGFLIGNGTKEPFTLLVKSIELI